MPLDTNLIGNALHDWQQAPDPLAAVAKLQALKNGIAQSQIQQQQLQQGAQAMETGALQLQEQKRAIQDAADLNNIYKSSMMPDPVTGALKLNREALYSGLAQGGHGDKVAAIQKIHNDADESAVKLKLTTSQLQKAQTDAADTQQEYVGRQLLAIQDAGYSPAAFSAALAAAADNGAIPRESAAKLYAQYLENPTAAGVKELITPLIGSSKAAQAILAQRAATAAAVTQEKNAAQTRLETQADQALKALSGATAANFDQLRAAAIDAQTKASRPPGAIPGNLAGLAQFNDALLTPAERAAGKRADTAQAALNTQRGVENANRAAQLNISRADLKLRQDEAKKKYGDPMADLSPADKTIAQKLAAGDYQMSILNRLQNKELIMAAAMTVNPQLTQATYDTKQAFTNPNKQQSKNLGTIARIVGHIARYEENSKAIGLSPGYGLGMSLTGAQKRLHEDAHAIGAEGEKLLSGGVGTKAQMQAWQDALQAPLESTRQQAIDEFSQLIGSQYEAMNQTYRAGVGADLPLPKYVTPAARAWMKAKGIDIAEEPAAAAAAPLPARLTAADVGKTYTNKDGKPITVTAVNPADPTQFKFNPAQ